MKVTIKKQYDHCSTITRKGIFYCQFHSDYEKSCHLGYKINPNGVPAEPCYRRIALRTADKLLLELGSNAMKSGHISLKISLWLKRLSLKSLK